jgi:thermostable 8-oxoguanine DNA glycosylase
MTKLIKLGDPDIDWTMKLKEAKENYKYQKELTEELDNKPDEFTWETILKIVLWKTNRYPIIKNDLRNDINDLRKNYTEEKARKVLEKLLDKKIAKGFNLPMASTVLRFACPNELQIIDQRAYRILMGVPIKIPFNSDKKIELYFNYIDKLKAECITFGVDFKNADRVLYELDKNVNKNTKIKT